MSTWLLLPAAGSGRRFGQTEKLLARLDGIAVIARSLGAFAGLVDGCIIPTRPDLRPRVEAALADSADPSWRLVDGGADRLASVQAGLAALPPGAERVLVHDAARPLVHRDDIRACLLALDAHPACLLACPCTDTIKRVTDGRVAETLDRETLVRAQTPQGFHLAAASAAYQAAGGVSHTDDAGVLEAAGIPVQVVLARHPNPKLTTAADLPLLEAMLAAG